MTVQSLPSCLANASPAAQLTTGRLPERLLRLLLGLGLYGVSIALMVEGQVGAAPWDIFHVGASSHADLSMGVTLMLTALGVLVAWIPLRQVPGVGTAANAVLLRPFADLSLSVLPTPEQLWARYAFMLSGRRVRRRTMYIGAQLGPGPRDGLMTGLVRRTGLSVRFIRTAIEVTVIIAGVFLGGKLGLGTIVFAFGVGPLTQSLLRYLVVPMNVPETSFATPELQASAATSRAAPPWIHPPLAIDSILGLAGTEPISRRPESRSRSGRTSPTGEVDTTPER